MKWRGRHGSFLERADALDHPEDSGGGDEDTSDELNTFDLRSERANEKPRGDKQGDLGKFDSDVEAHEREDLFVLGDIDENVSENAGEPQSVNETESEDQNDAAFTDLLEPEVFDANPGDAGGDHDFNVGRGEIHPPHDGAGQGEGVGEGEEEGLSQDGAESGGGEEDTDDEKDVVEALGDDVLESGEKPAPERGNVGVFDVANGVLGEQGDGLAGERTEGKNVLVRINDHDEFGFEVVIPVKPQFAFARNRDDFYFDVDEGDVIGVFRQEGLVDGEARIVEGVRDRLPVELEGEQAVESRLHFTEVNLPLIRRGLVHERITAKGWDVVIVAEFRQKVGDIDRAFENPLVGRGLEFKFHRVDFVAEEIGARSDHEECDGKKLAIHGREIRERVVNCKRIKKAPLPRSGSRGAVEVLASDL